MAGSLSFYCVFIITYTRELKRHICEGVFFGWTGSFVCVPLSLWAGGGAGRVPRVLQELGVRYPEPGQAKRKSHMEVCQCCVSRRVTA